MASGEWNGSKKAYKKLIEKIWGIVYVNYRIRTLLCNSGINDNLVYGQRRVCLKKKK